MVSVFFLFLFMILLVLFSILYWDSSLSSFASFAYCFSAFISYEDLHLLPLIWNDGSCFESTTATMILILLSLFIIVKDLIRWLCLLSSMDPIILHGVDQCSVLWVLRTSFPLSMELYLYLIMMTSIVMLRKDAIIWYSLGLLILFLIQFLKLYCFMIMLLIFGRIWRNVFLRLIVLELPICVLELN